MTNYNERFDELLYRLYNNAYIESNKPVLLNENVVHITNAKQAITSLMKELVTEAKPEEYDDYYATNPVEKGRKMGYNEAAREFEQNLLKALEEK